jgi:hypothetical protein
MPSEAEYVADIRKLGWSGLQKLWRAIGARDTPDWQLGKAFEYLVLRAFELDGGDVRWPYSVGLAGIEEVEQIDGSVQIGSFYCLLECKDEVGNISIGPIAKLRNQLLRRPGDDWHGVQQQGVHGAGPHARQIHDAAGHPALDRRPGGIRTQEKEIPPVFGAEIPTLRR